MIKNRVIEKSINSTSFLDEPVGFQERNAPLWSSSAKAGEFLARFQGDDESRGSRRRRQTMLHRCLNLELELIKILQADAQLGISQMPGKTTVRE